MKRLLCIAIALSGCLSLSAQSTDKQSVIIGEKVNKPNAILHLNPPGKDQGFLPPQLSSTERIGIKPYSPDDDGLIVFDITEKSYYHWKTGKWHKGLGLEAIPDPLGHAGKILTTDGTSLSWITHERPGVNTGEGLSSLTDDTGVPYLSVNTDKKTISVNANNELQVSDGGITSAKIASGGMDKILVTDSDGDVTWADKTVFADDQSLKLTNNLLAIEGANSVDLSALPAGGQLSGTLGSLTLLENTVSSENIRDNAITSGDILDSTILEKDIASQAVTADKIASGGVNKVLSTNASGQVTWIDQSILLAPDSAILNETITNIALTENQLQITEANTESGVDLNQLAANGDVTGNLNTTKVTKIQNQPVSPATLTAADAGKIMVWDGSQWVASQSTLNAGYYAMDPSQFTTFKSDNTTDRHNTQVLFSDNTFLTAYEDGVGEENIGGINLPDGAVINELIIYYMDKDATRNMRLIFTRKSFMGGNEELLSWTSAGRTATINTATFTSFNGRGVINNASYSYRIRVTFDVTNEDNWDTPDEALQRLYGVRIKYTSGY